MHQCTANHAAVGYLAPIVSGSLCEDNEKDMTIKPITFTQLLKPRACTLYVGS